LRTTRLGEDFADGRRQGGFSVIDVSNRSNIQNAVSIDRMLLGFE
jgi:hypothetical protein